MSKCLSLGVAHPGRPELFSLPVPPLRPGAAEVKTVYSGLSAGTELAYVKGSDPAARSRHDPDYGVFIPDDQVRRYPVTCMGYMEVGQVARSRRRGLDEGSLVAAAYGHRSHHVLTETDVIVPVPPGLDPVLGIYLAQMGPICANGLLHAAAEFHGAAAVTLADGVAGRAVLVTGAGVVGLLTALFARQHGAAETAVWDPDPRRVATAKALGLLTVDDRGDPLWRWCKQRWVHGAADRGADVVFQCRGRASVLHEALRALRPQGVVVDLAFYQESATELRLGEEFHHNGLTIRCAQIARVPRGLSGRWHRRRLADETAQLLAATGAAIRRHLITDILPVTQAPSFLLELASRQHHTMQAVFTFDTARSDYRGRRPPGAGCHSAIGS
jgi:threonine dehydrogenase-like Zn-dependent dehydrogenase